MKPGRELDALVAEKVMGLTVCRNEACEGCDSDMWMLDGTIWSRDPLTHYSTDISAAWEVVEKVRSEGQRIDLWDGPSGWRVRFATESRAHRPPVPCASESVAHAICLAALKAVGYEVDDG